MTSFSKTLLASTLGVFLAYVLMFFLGIMIMVGFAAVLGDTKPDTPKNAVLKIDLDKPIGDRTADNRFKNIALKGLSVDETTGLPEIIAALARAKADDNIKCVYITGSSANIGYATAKELREAIADFARRKPVLAYSEAYTQKAYYVAAAANRVLLNPSGMMEFGGLSAKVMFYKNTLEKLGVEMQVIRVGKYKSAVEPYINTAMSAENREQTRAYLSGIYNTVVSDVAHSRHMTEEAVKGLVNEMPVRDANDAKAHGLIDGIAYKDEVLAALGKICGEKPDELNVVEPGDYIDGKGNETGGKQVAVVYLSGNVVDGEGGDDDIGSARYIRELQEIRNDDDVKAVVLRINSGGGSAMASEVIWREVELLKKVKPVYTSVADMAASGAYYIGCAGKKLYVQPNSLTGSIGIFALIPNLGKLMQEKLGVTQDEVNVGDHAGFGDLTRPLNDFERALLQKQLETFYNQFIKRVADGRKMSESAVLPLAGGHVYCGSDAIKNGLADGYGNLNAVIAIAAKDAGLSKYGIAEYPKPGGPFSAFINKTTKEIKARLLKEELGEAATVYRQIKNATGMKGIMARYEVSLN